ncbi:hypothetical protein RHODGE_RHODGE_02309 [Rhodoplanes serenus]|uniref:Uncharacterized protein n=1 Tax=Rhodoplanes serenus TaxID=200615 RepID=A0A3S4B4R9_9BRAD|nr:hypothetical protein [Rhodoplanes serenus]VCU09136.1 hypothetical protein RHODGE_RHODGE_02309 [Rhodoplanes serenus]
MSASDEVYCRLDKRNRIVGVGGAWDRFALANDGGAVTAARVLGTDFLSHVSGEATRSLLDRVLRGARRSSAPVVLPFRCDSPECERHMEMTVQAEPASGILLAYRVLRVVPLPVPLRFVGSGLPRGRMLFRCSTCNRLLRDGRWHEPSSVDVPATPIAVSYGVCHDCRDTVERLLPAA